MTKLSRKRLQKACNVVTACTVELYIMELYLTVVMLFDESTSDIPTGDGPAGLNIGMPLVGGTLKKFYQV